MIDEIKWAQRAIVVSVSNQREAEAAIPSLLRNCESRNILAVLGAVDLEVITGHGKTPHEDEESYKLNALNGMYQLANDENEELEQWGGYLDLVIIRGSGEWVAKLVSLCDKYNVDVCIVAC